MDEADNSLMEGRGGSRGSRGSRGCHHCDWPTWSKLPAKIHAESAELSISLHSTLVPPQASPADTCAGCTFPRMAPITEDFVLTISDDETHSLEEDSEPKTTKQGTRAPSKKRKRTDKDRYLADGVSTNNTDRAPKKRKNKTNEGLSSRRDASEDDEDRETSWAARGEDDGAMDSDFEFQIGNVDTGLVEGFDGWEAHDRAQPNGGQPDKRAVDIDELIKRRRKGIGPEIPAQGILPSSKNKDQHQLYGGDLSEMEVEDEVDNGPASSEEPAVEEDETLAPDGFGMGATVTDEEIEVAQQGDESDPGSDSAVSSEDESIAVPVPHPDDEASDNALVEDNEDYEEQIRREAFFAPEDDTKKSKAKQSSSDSFQNMSLSRPILKGLASVGFSTPTPIQAKTIPMALLGKDVVGGAVTGSGKTAAFVVPILERLLYRPKKVPTSRVAILMPTRELAVQCFNVSQKLASFTDITFALLVGGFSLREQEKTLRGRPDILIATPGRFIDHMRNSPSFTTDTLEILVLDEADRMLEDGFADELNEILTTIPKSRQTMLFSATMTSRVDSLIRLGLNRPVRLLINSTNQTVTTLTQEFVRLRPGREDKRLGYLIHLCKEVFSTRTIIFFRQKKEAHRVRILFGLCGLSSAELHGNMSQDQRLSALTSFRTGEATHLLATDVASRGLDIKGVETVFNYTAPQNLNIYLHRVGRTARAGAPGRSCTLAAESDRKVVKAAVKAARAQGAKVVSRNIDSSAVDQWQQKIDGLADEVDAILQEEKALKQMGEAERDVRKAENVMEYEDEIKTRPRRTWFESEKEKKEARAKGAVELNGVQGGKSQKEGKGKLSGKERKSLDAGRERREGRVWKKGRGDGLVKGKAKEKGNGKVKPGKRDQGARKGKAGKVRR
ncbi:MAG: hypothetical protein LQ349_004952 [Xanthoria aureola]|nr:MAG: hypothetical protein LQ349_004952 [Xanthoria aureola]